MELSTSVHMNLLKSVTLSEFPRTEKAAGFKTSFKLKRIYLETASELPVWGSHVKEDRVERPQ